MKYTFHIGTEKTGTTSIQKALWLDRPNLAKRKILVPTLFGSPNHMELAAAICPLSKTNELQIIEMTRQACSHEEYKKRLRDQIFQEIQADDFERVVISNEHCHSRVVSSIDVARLLDLFDADPKNCEIIVYLRRQDRLAVRLYSTVLKLGGKIDLFPQPEHGVLPWYFDYERLLDLYARQIPKKNIHVRIYETGGFHQGNVVNDFYNLARLGITPTITPEENKSLSLAQGLFLELFNKPFPILSGDKMNPERGNIEMVINEVLPEKKWLPKRNSATEFYALFKESNQRVVEKYLPLHDRPTLFEEDFTEYPLKPVKSTLSQEELMQFVEAIWRFRN